MKILLLILSMFVTQTVFSAEVEIRDLTINELQLQNKTRGWGLELLKQYDIKEATNIDALDRLFVSWYKDKSKEKVSDTQLIYGLSVVVQ